MMRPHRFPCTPILVLTALIAWTGCDSGGSGDPTGDLSGIVREADGGAPVPGVNMTLGTLQTTTDQDGGYFFRGLPAGTAMRLRASTSRFDEFSAEITLQEGANTRDITLSRKRYYTFDGPMIDSGVYLPAGVATYRGVVVFVLPGDADSRGFANGSALSLPGRSADIVSRMNAHAESLRERSLNLASRHDLALMGLNRPDESLAFDDVLDALTQIAEESGRPELAEAPMLMIGHSAGGCFGYEFTMANPERIVGFVTQKGQCHGTRVAGEGGGVPGYFFIGGFDLPERAANITSVFERNRIDGAVWAVAIQPGAGHEPVMDMDLFEHWIDAVLEIRLPDVVTPGSAVNLDPVDQTTGWLGNRRTFEIAPYEAYADDPLQAAWLPTMQAAQEWQAFVSGD